MSTLKRWSIEILILVVLILCIAMTIRTHLENKRLLERATAAEKARDEGLQQAALGKEAATRAQGLQARLDAMETERMEMAKSIAILQDALAKRPAPPRPGPVPTEQAQLVADLRGMGTAPGATTQGLSFQWGDAPTLWTWGKESARVPALEARMQTLEEYGATTKLALDKTTDQLRATEDQRNEFRTSAVRFEGAYRAEVTRGDNMKVEVGELTKQRDRARRTRVYIGLGAFVAGVWLGHR